ncbi:hypothetical protein F4678DRAFT_32688 [Xylaria arbuscula]|nr:hypothetical protein F4678DRAFT_32688 [Xylaria arbuscula]
MEQNAASFGGNESKALAIRPKPSTGTSLLLPLEASIDTSPYTSPLLAVYFANGPPFSVHKQLLDKSPKLSSACVNNMTLHLADIPSGVGHILVHYLFTGVYEYLKPSRTRCHRTDAVEFATAVHVYDVAREYELPELAGLTRGEIERLGACLPVLRVFDVLEDTLSTNTINDIWIQSYLESVVRPFIDNPLSPLIGLPNSGNRALLFTYRLFKAVIERCREKTDSFSAIQDSHDGPAETYIATEQVNHFRLQSATHAVERAPEHGLGTASKRRRKQRRRKQKQKKTKGITEAGHENGNSSSSAALPSADMMSRCNPTTRMNSKARRQARRLDLNHRLAAIDRTQAAPSPMPKEDEVEFISQLRSPSNNCSPRQSAGSAHDLCPEQDNTRGSIALDTSSAPCEEAVSGLLDGGHVDVDELAMEYDSACDLFTQEQYEAYLQEKQEWEREWP